MQSYPDLPSFAKLGDIAYNNRWLNTNAQITQHRHAPLTALIYNFHDPKKLQ